MTTTPTTTSTPDAPSMVRLSVTVPLEQGNWLCNEANAPRFRETTVSAVIRELVSDAMAIADHMARITIEPPQDRATTIAAARAYLDAAGIRPEELL